MSASPLVKILVDDEPRWGRREGDMIVLEVGGSPVEAATATYLPPADPTKIIAVHLSYRSRVEEYGASTPVEPSYFLKPPSALARPGGKIPKPRGSHFLNYEGEVAAVIGRPMKGVAAEQTLDYVLGFTCANDVGLHDFRHADRGSMLRVKGQDGFLPLGPELVPATEWDPNSYTLRTYLNGRVVQEGTADELLWDVRYLLADLCRLMTLVPGDVILTGTPANSRPMEVGDVVEVEVTGLGLLRSVVVDENVDLSGPGEQMKTSANTLHVALAIPEGEAERRAAEGSVQ